MVVQSLNSKLDLASELFFHPDAPYHISDETSMWELSRWQHPRIIPINHCAAYYYCLARDIILIIATSPQGTRYSPITWPYVYWLWTDKHLSRDSDLQDETPILSKRFHFRSLQAKGGVALNSWRVATGYAKIPWKKNKFWTIYVCMQCRYASHRLPMVTGIYTGKTWIVSARAE